VQCKVAQIQKTPSPPRSFISDLALKLALITKMNPFIHIIKVDIFIDITLYNETKGNLQTSHFYSQYHSCFYQFLTWQAAV